jgi:purine-binding chemotaxis protein CheW
MKQKQDNQTLADQQDALSLYFDCLLSPEGLEPETPDPESGLELQALDGRNDIAEPTGHNSVSTEQVMAETVEAHESPSETVMAFDGESGNAGQTHDTQWPADDVNTVSGQDVTEQEERDFLRVSRRRQSEQTLVQASSELESAAQPNLKEPARQRSLEETLAAKPVGDCASIIAGEQSRLASGDSRPASPDKPEQPDKPLSQAEPVARPSIVFSEMDKDGKPRETVLIPRSQRLLAGSNGTPNPDSKVSSGQPKVADSQVQESTQTAFNGTTQTTVPTVRGTVPMPSPSVSASASEPADREVKRQAITPPPNVERAVTEAPKLDLSLFLPKIKTLDDDEIARQIQTLTQAAVSQAQLETDLAHASQLEKLRAVSAHGKDAELIRNIDNAPDWAVPDFQALLFAVAGLKLAVPLVELNGILVWGKDYLTEMPGHAPWYLGVIRHLGINIPVIDTLQQVVPSTRWPKNHLQDKNFKHIILIDEGRWGLACEQVLEVITLCTDEVKWRSSATSRRWLRGTVIDHMCALVDTSEFATLLASGKDKPLS